MDKFKKFLGHLIEDVLILSGLGLIIYQTYQLNEAVAAYLTGAILLSYGIMLSRR